MIQGAESTYPVPRANPNFIEGRLGPPMIEASTARALGLRDGQVVEALVQARGDQLGLLLRGKMIDGPRMSDSPLMSDIARTPGSPQMGDSARMADWKPGQSVWLRVQVNPAGLWVLQPVSPAAAQAPPMLESSAQAAISRVGNLLFRPPGMSEILQLFKPGTLDALLATVSRPDLQQQWQAMRLSMSRLSPEAIRGAVAAAMGAEVWMARGKGLAVEDPKQLLRKLLEALQDGDGASSDDVAATRQVQQGIDEIESAQLHAVQAQAQREMFFSMVIPFRDANPVELSFKSRPASAGQARLLTVNVHSRNRELGELWLKTELHGERDVELMMWARQPEVVSQARQRSGLLGQELREAGLQMRSFQAIHGARPAQPPEPAPSGRGMILDLQA